MKIYTKSFLSKRSQHRWTPEEHAIRKARKAEKSRNYARLQKKFGSFLERERVNLEDIKS